MINFAAGLITIFLCQSLFAYEVPAPLRNLLKNQKEQIYVGRNCEMKVYENQQGFHIDAYERDGNGNINQDFNFGRFTLNDSYELYDFWQYSDGFEAVSRYFSDFGVAFDRMSTMTAGGVINGKRLIEINFKRHNGLHMSTFYEFECSITL